MHVPANKYCQYLLFISGILKFESIVSKSQSLHIDTTQTILRITKWKQFT
jgi:hypothetical protein